MAIPVTSEDTNIQKQGARLVFRNSSGIPYVLLFNESQTQIEVWKGNATTPTSFSEPDAGNGPASATYLAPAGCIDSSDVIHIAYLDTQSGMSGGGFKYATFRADGTNDDFVVDTVEIPWNDEPPTAPYISISLDSNEYLHVVYTSEDTSMGTGYETVNYVNDVGSHGVFSSALIVDGVPALIETFFPDITIDSDNVPVIVYNTRGGGNNHIRVAQGDANNPASFSLVTVFADDNSIATNTSSYRSLASIAVDSLGNHHVAYIDLDTTGVMDGDLEIRTHNYGDDWTTWQTADTVDTGNLQQPSLTIDGVNIYLFCEDLDINDIVYYTDSGGSWSSQSVLEVGTFNSVISKWAFWVDNDSTRVIRSSLIYYFDGSDAVAVQDGTSWSNVTDADDGSIATSATNDGTGGSASADYIQIEGTNAPASGGTIGGVSARLHDGVNWWRYVLLNVPSGGWTWAKIQALETRIWWVSNIVNARIYVDGDAGGTELVAIINPKSATGGIARLEIVVHIDEPATEIDYTFEDNTSNIWWDTLSIGGVSDLSINVDDSVTTTEDVEINNIQLGDINVDDSIATSEDVSINLPVGDLDINVNDAVTISENISILLISNIEINDSIAVEENIAIVNTQLGGIFVDDLATVSENITNSTTSSVDVNESISISENIVASNEQLGGIDVIDSISITELVQIGANLFISVNDNVAVTEDTTITNIQLGDISIFEDITITENISLSFILSVNVSDSIAVTENVVISSVQLGNIDVFDSVTINELVQTGRDLFVSVNDVIAVSEDVVIIFSAKEDLNIDVNDSIAISETIVIANIQLGVVSVFEDVTITENIVDSLVNRIDIFDSITVNDDVVISITVVDDYNISVFDGISVSEDVETIETLGVNVSESISITENVVVQNNQLGFIDVFDSITITENIVNGTSLVIDLSGLRWGVQIT